MTWVGLLLVGVGLGDLLRSCLAVRAPASLPAAVGAAAVVVLGVIAGPPDPVGAVALGVVAALVVAWAVTVERFASGRGGAPAPLVVLGAGLGAGVLLAPVAPPAQGWWAQWLAGAPWPWLDGVAPDRALLLLGVVLVQLSTGNVVVRLVLAATGTVAPSVAPADDPGARLQGGRLLGPMERVVIVGLGLAGEVTAASIVIAAKGLLRWPELSSSREQHAIHKLTEYFLVGSFVSWSVALLGLALSGPLSGPLSG